MASDKPSQKHSFLDRFIRGARMDARRAIIEEMFNDMYKDRHKIYVMNFFRGLFFGLGSVIGGTLVVALIVWVLSFFVHIPGIGDTAQNAQQKLETSQQKR